MRAAIAFILLAAATSTAHAGTNELSLGETRRALHTSSANALTDSAMVAGSLTYAHRLNIAPMPELEMWADASFGWGGADGTMFQTLTTQLDTITLSVGGHLRYPLHRLVVASARLDVGSSRASVSLNDDAGHSASDHGWGAMTAGNVGLDLYAVNRPKFSFGLRLELGYVETSAVSMTAKPDSQSDGTLQLQMSAAGLGSLDLSGSTFTASIVSQF